MVDCRVFIFFLHPLTRHSVPVDFEQIQRKYWHHMKYSLVFPLTCCKSVNCKHFEEAYFLKGVFICHCDWRLASSFLSRKKNNFSKMSLINMPTYCQNKYFFYFLMECFVSLENANCETYVLKIGVNHLFVTLFPQVAMTEESYYGKWSRQ